MSALSMASLSLIVWNVLVSKDASGNGVLRAVHRPLGGGKLVKIKKGQPTPNAYTVSKLVPVTPSRLLTKDEISEIGKRVAIS